MKTKINTLKGLKITHFRYKVKNDLVISLKLYLSNELVLRLYAPAGLEFNLDKLKKLREVKISKAEVKNINSFRVNFKNSKRIKINSEQFIEFAIENPNKIYI